MALTQVSSAGIKNAEVKTEDILDANVTTAKIAADAVTGAKIADDAVGAEHIEQLDADLAFADSAKAKFGAGTDLEIYSGGTGGKIHCNNGVLEIEADSFQVWNHAANEAIAKFTADGAVELYHNNVKKLNTDSGGIEVTGAVMPTGNISMVDSAELKLGASDDLKFYHNGTNSYLENDTGNLIIDNGSGVDMYINSGNDIYIRPQASENGIKVIGDGAVELYYDASKKFETITTGTKSTGQLKIYNGDDANHNVLECYNDNSNISAGFAQASDGDGQVFATKNDGTNTVLFRSDGDSYINGGDVGIGTTSPDAKLHISGTNDAIIRLESTDTGLGQDEIVGAIEFEKNDSSGAGAGIAGGIRCRSDDSYGARTYIAFSTRENSTGAAATDTEQFRILAQGGVTFNGDTADANGLDDYEEGTFTPTMPNSGSASFAGQVCTYTKIGRICICNMSLTWQASNSNYAVPDNSTTFQVGGLPFTAMGSTNYGGGNIVYTNGVDITSNGLGPLVWTGNAIMYYHYTDTTTASPTNSAWRSSWSGKNQILQIVYFTT